jgi:hypothetical protein
LYRAPNPLSQLLPPSRDLHWFTVPICTVQGVQRAVSAVCSKCTVQFMSTMHDTQYNA